MKIVLVSLVVVLLVSSLLSLVLLSNITFDNSLVGHATTVDGDISIIISDVLAISLTNDTINFGTCAINISKGYAVLDSSLSSSDEDNGDCVDGVFPSFLKIENIGNVPANVSVSFNESSSSFFNDSSSYLSYKTNNSLDAGCSSSELQLNFTNITSENSNYLACGNLSQTVDNNSFALYIRAFVNASTDGGGSLEVTFSAETVS